MSRFRESDYFDDDNSPQDNYEGIPDGYMEVVPPEIINHWHQVELDSHGEKVRFWILRHATEMASRSFLWRFLSASHKMRLITRTYYSMLDMVKPEE